MRVAVVEIGPSSSDLLVGDVGAGGPPSARTTARQPHGFATGDWQRALNSVGALVSDASEDGAERIVGLVTGASADASAFAERVRSLFTIEVDSIAGAAATALALDGLGERAGISAVAVFGAGPVAIRVAGHAAALLLDLSTLRASVQRPDRPLAPKHAAKVAERVRGSSVLGALPPGRVLVAAGPAVIGLGPGPRTVTSPPGDGSDDSLLVAALLRTLAAELHSSAVVVDPAAIRAGRLVAEAARADRELGA